MNARRLSLFVALAGACNSAPLPDFELVLSQMQVSQVEPAIVLPGSELDLVGQKFPTADVASLNVWLKGTFRASDTGESTRVGILLLPSAMSANRLTINADAAFMKNFPSPAGHFSGQVTVAAYSELNRKTYTSPSVDASFDIGTQLEPRLDSVSGGVIFLNDAVTILGDNFLLGTKEGKTQVELDGCFLPVGGIDCAKDGTAVAGMLLGATPQTEWDRTRISFPFSPDIAGIHPGAFTGTVRLRNVQPNQTVEGMSALPIAVTLQKPQISQVAPSRASVGQYVDITGGGFVGAGADEVTLIQLDGSFAPDSGGPSATVTGLILVTGYTSGTKTRYVLDENDALGHLTGNLRLAAGVFTGTITPIIRKGTDQLVGTPTQTTLGISPVKQVVFINFTASYRDSLEVFGLQAADELIREQVLALAKRDYAGINVDFRIEAPTDFALYTQIDVVGPDPNGLDGGSLQFGYDNTPGKDRGNQRLYDRIGGVNASTQSDGSAGYGGVFTEQFLAFSAHADPVVRQLDHPAPLFDTIFDAVRPKTGTPIEEAEANDVSSITDPSVCVAKARDRKTKVNCAVYVLANMIGTTMTHELGHSLGLADPDGELFHDPGDGDNRLMDVGDFRPFEERAELMGQGPGRFCVDEFTYLQTVLPGAVTVPLFGLDARPDCD